MSNSDSAKLIEDPPVSSDQRSTETECSTSFDKNDKESFLKSFIDSFREYRFEDDGIDTSHMTDMEKSIYATSRHPLARRLRSRHLQMIAIGGSIGTGLFIGSGYALWQGGPAGQLISYFLVGFSLYCVMNALGELSVQFPVSGSFNAFFSRFIEPSWGFTLGLMYSLSWLISFPSELVACALTVLYWNKSVNPAVWVAIFYVLICAINMFSVIGYGEVEFVLSIIKVLAVVGFIILGICIAGGVGEQGYLGTKYWHDPGAFNHGFKGVCSCFISAAFSFGGIELVALAASETANPRKSLPKAIKQVFWRIAIFYLVTSVVIGCLVPFNDDRLLTGTSSVDIAASPFVIAISSAGIKVLPDIMNAVILLAVVSVGNSAVYGCSRSLASLAVQGLLPRIVGYVDRKGRPLVAILIASLFGLLGFLVGAQDEEVVFTWLFSICSLGAFFTWASICLVHIRFRMALSYQGRSTDELIYSSPTGVWGSWAGMIVLILIIVGEVWVSIWPIWTTGPSLETFWKQCLSIVLIIVTWAVFKTVKGTWGLMWIKLENIDLDTGKRELNLEIVKQELAEERALLKLKPIWYKIFKFFC